LKIIKYNSWTLEDAADDSYWSKTNRNRSWNSYSELWFVDSIEIKHTAHNHEDLHLGQL
jgi:hypothetical protein